MTNTITQPVVKVQHKVKSALTLMVKIVAYFSVFMGISLLLSKLATIHGKEIPTEYFSGGYPSLIGLLDSELFMGIIFVITFAVLVYVLWLLWGLHEVAVHKAQKIASSQIQLVFALSLCGLFIHKAWWVLAIIIAFTRWDTIAHKLSEIIANGRSGEKK